MTKTSVLSKAEIDTLAALPSVQGVAVDASGDVVVLLDKDDARTRRHIADWRRHRGRQAEVRIIGPIVV